MSDQDSLLWVDVETSGLRAGHDLLLEVGLVVTGPDLTLITEATWTVPYRDATLAVVMERCDPVVRAMHEESGLWAECSAGEDGLSKLVAITSPALHPAVQQIASEISDLTREHGADTAPLAGSSVHFDDQWLRHWFRSFMDTRDAAGVYRRVDVSSWKEALKRTARGREIIASCPEPVRAHRAAHDIHDSISELRHYLVSLGLIGTVGGGHD